MTAGFDLRSAGHWLKALAPYGDVQTTWRLGNDGGGLDQVDWQMDLPYDYDHPALRRGALVEVFDGAARIGQAILGEPGRTETGLSFSAMGIYRQAERFMCLDGAAETTTTPDVAVDQAAARGCPLTRSGSLSAVALVDGNITEGLNSLSTLLTALAVEAEGYWMVDADAVIRIIEPPTVPDWHLIPGVADPGVADDEYASALIGRHRTGGALATVIREDTAATDRWGYAEVGVDLVPLGSMSTSRANTRLDGLLARGRSRLTFTDRLEVDGNQLLTAGGQPASLSDVRHGHLVRAHGLDAYSQWLNGNSWLDFVIGEANWANHADTITIAPIGLAARTWEDLLAESAPGAIKP